MAAEVGPSEPAREVPARKKIRLRAEGKTPTWNSCRQAYEEAPEVPAWDRGPPQDLAVPEKYRAPHTQVSLHEISTQNCPGYR